MINALFVYFGLLTILVVWSSRTVKSEEDFVIGNRSLNYWLTALSAHASDMSSWLFMGYPALIFSGGIFKSWVAVGLVLFMWLNWQFIAPKFRVMTGKWNCSTFSSFLHYRYKDDSGMLQLVSAIFSFGFYIVYICAGLVGLGLLGETIFNVDYYTSISIGASVVVTYVVLGGFITLAWLDFVQGLFLMGVLCVTPYLIVDNWGDVINQWSSHPQMLQFLPSSFTEGLSVIFMILGWGLGYFGQPHIITKFMGIKHVEEISKSKWVGMSWMILSLAAATLIGLLGFTFFKDGINDPQLVFVEMVKVTFSPFFAGLILCAILAATINVMSSQLLILSSTITEDIYKRFYNKNLSSKHLLRVTRISIVIATAFAFAIATLKISSIYNMVHYAWSGLGASFGSLVVLALYSNKGNRYGALAAIIVGGFTAAVWPLVNGYLPIPVDALIPGFILSFLSVLVVSTLTEEKEKTSSSFDLTQA